MLLSRLIIKVQLQTNNFVDDILERENKLVPVVTILLSTRNSTKLEYPALMVPTPLNKGTVVRLLSFARVLFHNL